MTFLLIFLIKILANFMPNNNNNLIATIQGKVIWFYYLNNKKFIYKFIKWFLIGYK